MRNRFFPPRKSKAGEEGKRFGFWGNLPLSRKLLLAFGSLFVFAVIIAVITLNGLNRTQAAYKDALAKGIEIRRLSDQLATSLLQARSNERNFLLHWRQEGYYTAQKNYVTLYTKNVADMRKDLEQLTVFGPVVETLSTGDTTQAQYEADIASLTQNVDEYEKSFNALLAAHLKKGFDDVTDYENQFRTAATSMDSGLFYGQAGIEQIKVTFLRVRISEKNYLANSEQSYATEIQTYMPLLEEQIKATDKLKPGEKTELLKQADAYLTAFNSLVELDKEIDTYNQELIRSSSEVEALTAKIKSLGEQLATDDINKASVNSVQTFTISIITVLIVLVLSILLSLTFSRQLTRPIVSLTRVAQEISAGRFDIHAQVESADEIGALAQTFNDMTVQLQGALQNLDHRAKEAESARAEAESARAEVDKAQIALHAQLDETQVIAHIAESMQGEQDLVTLSQAVLSELRQSLGSVMGAIFVREGDVLLLVGSYAYSRRKNVSNNFRLGEGIVGQAALEKQPILITSAPPDYVSIATGTMELAPRVIMAVPFMRDGNVVGVIELASLNEFSAAQITLLNKALENIAIAFSTAQARSQINALLEKTQQQAQELRVREEELKSINEELQVQAENLRISQDFLRRQQKELESANVELEERASTLQEQRTVLDQQNRDLTDAQKELKRKAEELSSANKYKSEFLANMSHELRTPLNSLLILARMFANNDEGNLTTDQVESAQIIFNSGTDLLNLINEILDLSKVEAGRMTFHLAPMEFENLANNMRAVFDHVAQEKKLGFEISISGGLPARIESDQQRVEQIIKNLLSNAFKFTPEGVVKICIEPAGEMAAIRVSDSGIGMNPDQQARVFEAFQQADGSTSRKYGGTGLGLTISREMASKLGGRIELVSEPGKGSTFSLLLPLQRQQDASESDPGIAPASGTPIQAAAESEPLREKIQMAKPIPKFKPFIDDDYDQIRNGDKVLLVIEDDANFAKVVLDYGRKQDFKCVTAGDGESGLQIAKTHKPDAILLDLKLPGMSGWEVLDSLKQDSALRHIPVHILSASEESMDAYKRGAVGFLAKPVSQEGLDGVFQKIGEFLARNIRSLLIVEDDFGLRYSVRQLLAGSDVKISEAEKGSTAIELLRKQQFDCMILDLTLPDMTGFELLNRIHVDETVNKCPVIVYTGKALSEEENEQLLKYTNSVIIKGVKSPERLLDETALFLHRVVADMPEEKQDTIRRLHDRNAVFNDKHILVVDDDMRNAFALSRLLGDKGLKISLARSGAKAIEMLENVNDIDLVLMDIMMPEMDGYETMRRIRAQQRFKNLPMLALTAKAMKGDLEKCVEAGANDYLSKPVDVERLFSMLRVWLYR